MYRMIFANLSGKREKERVQMTSFRRFISLLELRINYYQLQTAIS